jgi:hypothetical protein
MKATSIVTAILVMALAVNSWASSNLNLSKSNVNIYREIPNAAVTTASVNLTGTGDTETVYNTPAKGDFILTQFCASPDAPSGIRLDATGLGSIAQTGGTSCFTFSPGVSIPKSSTLSCSSLPTVVAGTASSSVSSAPALIAATYFCTISGLQTVK